MSPELQHLAGRIRSELDALDVVLRRVQEGWGRAQRTADDYYLDSVALNIHGLYSGLERLFELIAQVIDHLVPGGDKWHHALLQQMCTRTISIRPKLQNWSKRSCLFLNRPGLNSLHLRIFSNSRPPQSEPPTPLKSS